MLLLLSVTPFIANEYHHHHHHYNNDVNKAENFSLAKFTDDVTSVVMNRMALMHDLLYFSISTSSPAISQDKTLSFYADRTLSTPVMSYVEFVDNISLIASTAHSLAASTEPPPASQYRQIDRLVEVSYLFRTIMAVIYFVTAIFAFIFNFFALLILFFGRRKKVQLNRFLSNLGFSDIIFAIFNIPFTYITLIYNTWWLPDFMCPLTSFVQVLAPTVSFYTLIAIGIGR